MQGNLGFSCDDYFEEYQACILENLKMRSMDDFYKFQELQKMKPINNKSS